jgi:hypothetical protein
MIHFKFVPEFAQFKGNASDSLRVGFCFNFHSDTPPMPVYKYTYGLARGFDVGQLLETMSWSCAKKPAFLSLD